jgi:hypothetical protein
MTKMWLEFSSKYFGLTRSFIEDYVRKCSNCAVAQPLKRVDVVKNITAKANWERIQIDLIDLRRYSESNDGFSWILHIIDVHSKFSFVYAMKQKSAEEVSIFLEFYLSFRSK